MRISTVIIAGSIAALSPVAASAQDAGNDTMATQQQDNDSDFPLGLLGLLGLAGLFGLKRNNRDNVSDRTTTTR